MRDGDHADNLQRVADTCLAVDADVICLNEVLRAVRTAPASPRPTLKPQKRPASATPLLNARRGKATCRPRGGAGDAARGGLWKRSVRSASSGTARVSGKRHPGAEAGILDAGRVMSTMPAPGDILLGEQPRRQRGSEGRRSRRGLAQATSALACAPRIWTTRADRASAEKQLRRSFWHFELKRNAPALRLICGDSQRVSEEGPSLPPSVGSAS